MYNEKFTMDSFEYDDFYIKDAKVDAKYFVQEIADVLEKLRKIYINTGDERIAKLIEELLPNSYKG